MPAVRRAALQRALEGASGADRRQGIAARRLERSGIGDSGFGWEIAGRARGALQMLQGIEALRFERSGIGESGSGWMALGARFKCCRALRRFDSNARDSATAVSGGRSRGALQMRQGIAALRFERSGFGESGFGWMAVGAICERARGHTGRAVPCGGLQKKAYAAR